MTDTEQALVSAVASRRAALRTRRDTMVEWLLAFAATAVTVAIGYSALELIMAPM